MRKLGWAALWWAILVLVFDGCRGQTTREPRPEIPARQEIAWQDLPALTPGASVGSPASLTASDGTGLELSSYQARCVVEGPLAFVELDLRFHNPSDRTLEGTFEIILPPDATVSRFAMGVGTFLEEAEMVERLAARQVFESYEHRRIDPALFEQQAGNQFRARIFPLRPHADKHVVLSYTHELDDDMPFVLPLRGLPQLQELVVDVAMTGVRDGRPQHARYLLREGHFQPDRDLVLGGERSALPVPDVPAMVAVRGGRFVVARIAPPHRVRRDDVDELSILVDTSASCGRGFSATLGKLGELARALPRRARLRVVAFDQDARTIFSGPAAGFDATAIAALRTRQARGATDLAAALGELARSPRTSSRLLVVTDGLATAGGVDARAMEARMKQLGKRGLERVDAWLVGAPRNDALAQRLAGSAKRQGSVLPARLDGAQVAERLATAPLPPVKIEVEGAAFHHPHRLYGLQPGDSALVFAEVERAGPVRVTWTGADRIDGDVTLDPIPVADPLAQRAVVSAKIRQLTRAYDRETTLRGKERLRADISRISVEHRVLSRFTSLLVLESEADYRRWGIDRRALADILEWENGTVALRHRRSSERVAADAVMDDPIAAVPDAIDELREKPGRDRDHDGIPNAVDACPAQPGGANAEPTLHGCPVLVVLDDAEIMILERVAFRPGEAQILPVSFPLLDEIAQLLQEHAELRIRIEGHTDDRGNAAVNRALSRRRAEAVRDYLVAQGIGRDRLEVAGLGDARPIARNDTEEGRARNRRVDFKVLNPEALHMEQERHRAPRPTLGTVGWRLPPSSGPVADVLNESDAKQALAKAEALVARQPTDVSAWLALGDACERAGRKNEAARAYGSLIDLYPGVADLRRYAGNRLERVGTKAALALAIDTYRQAIADRPDRPLAYRHLAYALVAQQQFEAAFAALAAAFDQSYAPASASAAMRVMTRDVALVAAAWGAAEPARRGEIARRIEALPLPVKPATQPELLFVLSWESDANELVLVVAPQPGTGAPNPNELPPNLTVVARRLSNERRGYGPAAAAFIGERTYPLHLGAYYAVQGPAGHAYGRVHVVDFDGSAIRTRHYPFFIEAQRGYADLGTLTGPLE